MEDVILSQNKRIRKHLESGRSINPLEALYMYGCFRLGARIYDLRKQGLRIMAKTIEITSPSVYNGKKHFTSYSLKTK